MTLNENRFIDWGIINYKRTERLLLEKGPKFAPTLSKIPYKDIVAKVEASITYLPDESKDQIQTSAAAILQRASLPNHNITKGKK